MNEPRSSWIRRIWPPLPVWQRLDLSVLLICIYTAIVSAFYQIIHYQPPTWSGVTAALTALVLSPLLTFRNREAYDRWWEARKLWGQLINDSRNLMLKLKSFPEITEAERQLILKTLIKTGNNKTRTADALHISLKTLHNKLKIYRDEA